MDVVFVNLAGGLRDAAVIWIVLLVLAILALMGLLGRPRLPERISPELRARGATLKRIRLAARADELERYAHEVEIAAERAAAMADRRREEWLAAQGLAESAWSAFDVAFAEAQRVIAAAALPTPRTPSTPAEYAFRERYLHRAAMSACTHRELSVLELSDALAHRNGWDPRLHPMEQDVVLRRAVRDNFLAGYQDATGREKDAWHSADMAAAAAMSLRAEAACAAENAREARCSVRPSRATSRPALRERLHWGAQVIAKTTRQAVSAG